MKRKKEMSQRTEKDFNLLDEAWIKVMDKSGTIIEVSILELFRNAHTFAMLAGESKPQDFAVLRLLLAILHASLGRQEDGLFVPLPNFTKLILDPADMVDRWENLWDSGQFPFRLIESYLERYRDRFWLFHPKRPFYQIPAQDPIKNRGTHNYAKKLQGTLSESKNTDRLFSHCAGDGKENLDYAEAARWLIHLNGFDDTSLKPVTKKLPSPGIGWLGKLGLIAISGENLFETLMLNFVLLPNGENEMWGIEKPIWALEELDWSERTPVPVPDNASQLLTLQSRWIYLDRDEEKEKVKGYWIMGGFFYEEDEEWFNEQMTLWQKKKASEQDYSPKQHNASRTLWRDLSALLASTTKDKHGRKAGNIAWIEKLQSMDVDLGRAKHFETVAMSYKRGSPSNDIIDSFSDGLNFSMLLLAEHNESWRTRILQEVNWTEKLVSQVRFLARDLIYAEGGSGDLVKDKMNESTTRAYFILDLPFRIWLEEIDPEQNRIDEVMESWREIARKIVRDFGQQMVKECSLKALVGRSFKASKNTDEQLYSSPKAYNRFIYQIQRI